MIDDGYVLEKQIIQTTTDEEKNTISEKQIIHVVKVDEKENLIGRHFFLFLHLGNTYFYNSLCK
jgi:hypothetical protein